MVSFREANRSMIGNGRPFFKIGFLLFCCELSTFFSELCVDIQGFKFFWDFHGDSSEIHGCFFEVLVSGWRMWLSGSTRKRNYIEH